MTKRPTPIEPTDDPTDNWQRLHPLTPWLRGGMAVVAILGFIVNSLADNLREAMSFGLSAGIGWIILVLILIIAVAAGYSLLWWRRARFRIGTESVELTSGIIFRRYSSLKLAQLEAIDIVHPLVARFFGLAELKLESAGGQGSNLSLTYLTATHAEQVRSSILAQRHASRGTTSPGTTSPSTISPGTTSPSTTSPCTISPNTTSPRVGTFAPGDSPDPSHLAPQPWASPPSTPTPAGSINHSSHSPASPHPDQPDSAAPGPFSQVPLPAQASTLSPMSAITSAGRDNSGAFPPVQSNPGYVPQKQDTSEAGIPGFISSGAGFPPEFSSSSVSHSQSSSLPHQSVPQSVPDPAASNREDEATPLPLLFRVPPAWTIRSYLRSSHPWIALSLFALILGLTIWLGVQRGNWNLTLGFIPVLFAMGQTVWKYIVTEMSFTGYVQPEGIRLTHGLLTQINQSIPAGRIQAVRLRQRVLWRKPNWWRIDLNVAGYGMEHAQNRTLLIPVADPVMAAMAVSTVMPRATTAANWSIIEQAMHATSATAGFVSTPERARLFDPFTYRRQGYATTEYALVIRTGWLTREVTVVPHDRVQGISASAGPWQRRRRLATIRFNSTQGPIVPAIPHLDEADAAALLAREVPLVTTLRREG